LQGGSAQGQAPDFHKHRISSDRFRGKGRKISLTDILMDIIDILMDILLAYPRDLSAGLILD
jgi:hypothetical protein